ncbi:DUF896 domain-containing protein [Paenibacillus chartarius]|uniref:UPF0291 protein ACFFK0_20075 n=1 Tax=Paenibacillus chartarius TaxID=747481 RepID=A0ABV6DPY4_9BACL
MDAEQTVQRINELARKAKTVGLTDEEIDERNELRSRYIQAFKSNLRQQLESIKFVDEEDKTKREN